MSAGEERQSWTSAHKRLTAVLATATAIVGLATGVLTLRDQLFTSSDEPDRETSSAQEGALTSATASRLSDDVQLSTFEELLGPATAKRRLQNDEWLVSTWESPDIAVSAFSANADDAAATELGSLGDCLGFSIFETGRGCAPERVETLRSGLHVTSMTVGESPALEALAQDGATFFPDADTGS